MSRPYFAALAPPAPTSDFFATTAPPNRNAYGLQRRAPSSFSSKRNIYHHFTSPRRSSDASSTLEIDSSTAVVVTPMDLHIHLSYRPYSPPVNAQPTFQPTSLQQVL